jgi:non-heme chloroperoxidase
MAEITEREQRQIDQANSSGQTAVVFIHGLWLLPSSWDNWVGLFEENSYAGVTPSWPDDPGPRRGPRGERDSGPSAHYRDALIGQVSAASA